MTDSDYPLVLNEEPPKLVPAALHKSVVIDYVHDFDLERVADKYAVDQNEIRRIVNDKGIQEQMVTTLGDVSALGNVAARRLLEALLQEALQGKESKGRTEARKLLARHFLPTKTEAKTEVVFYVEAPAKKSAEEWADQYQPPTLPAEVIDDDEDE